MKLNKLQVLKRNCASVKVGQSFHIFTKRTNYVLASWKPPSSIEQ